MLGYSYFGLDETSQERAWLMLTSNIPAVGGFFSIRRLGIEQAGRSDCSAFLESEVPIHTDSGWT